MSVCQAMYIILYMYHKHLNKPWFYIFFLRMVNLFGLLLEGLIFGDNLVECCFFVCASLHGGCVFGRCEGALIILEDRGYRWNFMVSSP